MVRRHRVLGAVVAVAAMLLAAVSGAPPGPAGASPPDPVAAGDDRPNIVLVLMDDFSLELLSTMPQARRMQREGASYRNAFVIDSLCCPSRAALLTGQTPYQNGVLTNTPNDGEQPIGGWAAFQRRGNLQRTYNVALQDAGYTTGYIGKFMNGYEVRRTADGRQTADPVPGWSDFEVIFGGGYNGWGYKSSYGSGDAPQVRDHPKPDRSLPDEEIDRHYSGTVAADKAVAFLKRHEREDAPYFLQVSVYAPHSQLQKAYPDSPQFPSALRDRAPAGDPTGGNCGAKACGDLTLADLTGYGDDRTDNAPTYLREDGTTAPAPAWRTNEVSLTDQQALTRYRDRARMVQSIDRTIARIRAHAGPDTYVVLTSDNGFHLGQHQLNGGKGTPYDSDSRVPLVVVGPGVTPGVRSQYVNNIDLAPTFEELAGLRPAEHRSGTSFAPSFSDPAAKGGRVAFFEHTYAKSQPGEVDHDQGSGGTIDIIPSFIAVRGDRGLLVRFDLDNSWRGEDFAWELYRYDVPWEDRNVFAEDHDEPWVQELRERLERFEECEPAECRAAAR